MLKSTESRHAVESSFVSSSWLWKIQSKWIRSLRKFARGIQGTTAPMLNVDLAKYVQTDNLGQLGM